MKQEQQPKATNAQTPIRSDARLISLPQGIQVYRDGKIRYYWYNQITDQSRHRLWRLMDQCLQLASNPNIHIWQGRRGVKKENPFMTDRGQWLATERQAEIAAIHHSENPHTPPGYYDQYGDWHTGWFEYPQYAKDVDRRLRALREGKAMPKNDIDIFANEAEERDPPMRQ